MNIVVFGANGFLGRYIVQELLNRNHHVTVFDNSNSILTPHTIWDKHVNCLRGDITNEWAVYGAIDGADVVYNLAAIADIGQCINTPAEAVKINVYGNSLILGACAKYNVSRFVFSSSLYAHSRNGGIYASTKRASEDIIKNFHQYYGVNYTILQYGTLYGPGATGDNSVLKYLTSAIHDKKIKYMGTGEEIREYIHVLDAAKLGVDILDIKYKNKSVIISGNYPIKVKDLFIMIQEIIGEEIEIEYNADVPPWKKESHYKVSPYSYNYDMELSNKLVSDSYIDMGLGLLQLTRQLKIKD